MKCEATANDSVVIYKKTFISYKQVWYINFFLQCTLTPGLLIFTKCNLNLVTNYFCNFAIFYYVFSFVFIIIIYYTSLVGSRFVIQVSASVAELHSQAESVCVVVQPVVVVVVAGRSSSSVWCPVLANVQRALETRKVQNGAEDIHYMEISSYYAHNAENFRHFFTPYFSLFNCGLS